MADDDEVSLDGLGDDEEESKDSEEGNAASKKEDEKGDDKKEAAESEAAKEDVKKDVKNEGDGGEDKNKKDDEQKEVEKEEKKDEKKEAAQNSAFDHYLASNNEFDDFLANEDPDFVRSLKELDDIKPPEDSEAEMDSVELDKSLLKKDSIKSRLGFRQKLTVLLKPYYWVKYFVDHLVFRVKNSKKIFIWLKEEGIAKGVAALKEKIAIVTAYISGAFKTFKKMRRRGKVFIFLFLAGGVFVAMNFLTLLSGSFLPHTTAQSVSSFAVVADKIFIIDTSRGRESFESPLRHTEHIVLLRRITANLLPSKSSTDNPLGLFELYIEGSNQEVAVEIKDRETELIDIMQRAIERTTFDDASDSKGKEVLKKNIRIRFNQILNKGRVKNLYFKLVSLKP